MDNFSDDEKFEVDTILEQRKRKGVLEYLVRWKDTGSEESTSWEKAESIAADCAQAIKDFLTAKAKKRSVSKSRKSSRSKSRSRSSSRGRKAAAKSVKSPRSRSRGRPKKETPEKPAVEETRSRGRPKKETPEKPAVEETTEKATVEEKAETATVEEKSEKAVVEEQTEKTTVQEKTETTPVQNEPEKTNSEGNNGSSSIFSSILSSSTTVFQSQSIMSEKKESENQDQGRVLRSSTMAARERLEVQRVHNEQRPVREDDNKPRSSIWKIADYGVIALFILSVVAALFLFVEKFVDLEDFKPNMGLLQSRLVAAVQNVVDLGQYGVDRLSAFWMYLIESVSGGSAHKEPSQPVPTQH